MKYIIAGAVFCLGLSAMAAQVDCTAKLQRAGGNIEEAKLALKHVDGDRQYYRQQLGGYEYFVKYDAQKDQVSYEAIDERGYLALSQLGRPIESDSVSVSASAIVRNSDHVALNCLRK
jgi:uncharacterized membrane protein